MTRRQVFVDTWAWVALVVRDDRDHQQADRLTGSLQAERALLITSNFVLAESLTYIRYHASLQAALLLAELADGLHQTGRLELITVDQPLWEAALTWFRRFDDHDFSFVDCTSFAIMHERAINDALTADRHFATAGFVPLGA